MSNRLLILFMLVVCAGLCPAQTLYNNCYIVNSCCDSTLIWNQFEVLPQIYSFKNSIAINRSLHLQDSENYLANESGDLQFATNGCVIVDNQGRVIPDSFGLLSKFSTQSCSELTKENGQTVYIQSATPTQRSCSIPNKSKPDDYTVFNLGINKLQNWDNIKGYNDVIIYTQINKDFDNHQFKVYYEGLIQLPEAFVPGLKLVKHADGESWWLIVPSRKAGSFVSIHISKDGLPIEQQISLPEYPYPTFLGGSDLQPIIGIKMAISHDGTKLASLDVFKGNIVLYKINRCNGMIYNPIKVYQMEGHDSTNYFWPLTYSGMSFSPNSRYLYAGLWHEELQFDTEADDIASSKYIVAKEYTYKIDFDTTGFNVPDYAFLPTIDFFDNYLTPSGKIIISGSNKNITNNWYAIIEDPDKSGVDCNFNLFGFKSHYAAFTPAPNIPNFDLGPLPPGYCTQSNADAEIESKNVDGSIVISVKNIPLGTKRVCLKIYDTLGRLLTIECFDVIPFQDYSKEIVLDHSYLPPACYVATAEFDTGGFVSKKVLVMK